MLAPLCVAPAPKTQWSAPETQLSVFATGVVAGKQELVLATAERRVTPSSASEQCCLSSGVIQHA
jgi:hypothetical protein